MTTEDNTNRISANQPRFPDIQAQMIVRSPKQFDELVTSRTLANRLAEDKNVIKDISDFRWSAI